MAVNSYKQWRLQAAKEDKRSGGEDWRARDASPLYDYRVIRYRYNELRDVRRSGDPQQLLYYLNEGLHGNMGGMGEPGLYNKAKLGTKHLITQYISELGAALADLEAVSDDDIPHHEKLAYFRRAETCFGRSALMFSGAGSLGAFHIGVAKELARQDLLPRVVSGASAGSIVAAIVGTHPREELVSVFEAHKIGGDFEALDEDRTQANRQLRQDDLAGMVADTIPDLTFLEALELTGVNLNISVAPAELHQRSRMLNAATSPNACIREAVIASCAIPGVFPAVTLMAKDANNQRRPYVASRKWMDGSITDDLPAKRIARQYGVNHFISSQANPLYLWGLNSGAAGEDLPSRMAAIYHRGLREWLRTIYPTVMESVRYLYPLNTYTRFWFSVMTQEYTADINLIPQPDILHPSKLLSRLTNEETQRLVLAGERATWPKVEMIRNCTTLSRRIENALLRLESKSTYMPLKRAV